MGITRYSEISSTEERKQALANFLNEENDDDLTAEDIQDSAYDASYYQTPYGEFQILTDEEADFCHKEAIQSIIDDVGIAKTFTKDAFEYIRQHFANTDDLEEFIRNDYDSYCRDIENEESSPFENRLQEELLEMLERATDLGFSRKDAVFYLQSKDKTLDELISELDSADAEYDIDDFDALNLYHAKEFFEGYEDNKEDYIERYAQHIIDEYDGDLTQWVIDNFGEDELNGFIQNGIITFDMDEITEYCKEQDGRGNELARWDGEENEIDLKGETYYIYKQDDRSIERISKSQLKENLEPEL